MDLGPMTSATLRGTTCPKGPGLRGTTNRWEAMERDDPRSRVRSRGGYPPTRPPRADSATRLREWNHRPQYQYSMAREIFPKAVPSCDRKFDSWPYARSPISF